MTVHIAAKGHSLRHVIDIELQLRGPLVDKLHAAAAARKKRPADLLAEVIELVITDNLFDAVIG